MIRHYVIFEIKPDTPPGAIQLAFAKLYELKNIIPGFLRAAAGECQFFKAGTQYPRLYGLSIDFTDSDAYQHFLESEAAAPIKNNLLDLVEGGLQGLYGFDLGYLDMDDDASAAHPLNRHRVLRPRLAPRGM